MTSIQKNSNKMYQVRAYYKNDAGDEQTYITALFADVRDAHNIYQYAMYELENHFTALELLEYPRKDTPVIIDRETTKGYKANRSKERKSLRLILNKRHLAVEKERVEKRMLEKQKLFEKRMSEIIQCMIDSHPEKNLKCGGRLRSRDLC
jgi:ribosomal protein L35